MKTPGFSTTRPQLVLFTDLDASLVGADISLSDGAVRPALDWLHDNQIPLVLCTSKTRAEVEFLRKKLKNDDPFIIENGGALYIPEGYFTTIPSASYQKDGYHVIELGVPYDTVRNAFHRIERQVGIPLFGFGDMRVEDIMQLTGLARPDAELARQREYDEPFLVKNHHALLEKICEAANQYGLTVMPGSRFFHLLGCTDKGLASRILIDCYRHERVEVYTAGIGDSRTDLPMLGVVDWPFLVERPGGGHLEGITLRGLTCLPGIGPAGWAGAIKKLLGPSPFRHPFSFYPFPLAC